MMNLILASVLNSYDQALNGRKKKKRESEQAKLTAAGASVVPVGSAPSSAARDASSRLVIPQILIFVPDNFCIIVRGKL